MTGKLFDFEKLKNFADREFLVHRTTHNEEKIYSYGEVITIAQVFLDFLMKIDAKNTRISLQCPHSPALCVILLSILNGGCSFCPISHDASEEEALDAVRKYGSPFLISNVYLSKSNDLAQLVGRKIVLNTEFYIFHIINEEDEFHQLPNECYCIKTSGSTGTPKVVRVPYQCIMPNIKVLSELLEISSNDLIFMSSPITFDPFVVEFFLALWNGAALLITSPAIRTTPHKLIKVLQPKQLRGVTVVQSTPSLFRLFGVQNIQDLILCKETSIRILLLGGERFPSIDEILNWIAKNDYHTRIFNIYGITEVSCWSTLHEIKPSQTEKRIPIGLPIDSETQVRVVNDKNETLSTGLGEIQIGSASRKCIIENEAQTEISSTEILFRSTGDIGYISEGTIFYEGRKSEMIKRYGHRVHMGQLAKTILETDGVLNTCCTFDDEHMKLICFILKDTNRTKTEIQREILRNLKNFEKPDAIEFVDHFPVTSHGKISEKKLLQLYEGLANNTPIKIFERFITNVLCLDLDCYRSVNDNTPKQRRVSLDISFLEAGGTSFQALTLSTEIEHVLQRPERKLLEMLLNETTSIWDILDYISKINTVPVRFPIPPDSSNKKNLKEILKVKWQYDTGKCVDASPSCYGTVVCVGSHSHLLITLDSKSGREVSTCVLPDRIECQVTFVDHRQLLVGCYDGHLYAIDYSCGKIEWEFDCGGMIKARPLQNRNLVVIGNYSMEGNLLCLDLKNKSALWRIQVGSKGIFSSPVQINEKSVLACTLSGEIVRVIFNSGHIVWKTKLQNPIFSTPAMLTEHTVVVAEVSGVIHCLDVDSGTELWNLQTDGNIFSSIIVHKTVGKSFIIFGNHDRNVYCLNSAQPTEYPAISWKSVLNSAIYSTPIILDIFADILAVLSCSTKGGIYILDFYTGSILFTLHLDNEIFSSPIMMENRIYVGCRNNNLVCLELQYEKQINKDNL